MGKYIDLVTVSFGDTMKVYVAPNYSRIKEGDEIVAETGIVVEGFEKARGLVVNVQSFVDENSDIVKLAKLLCDQTDLLRFSKWYQRKEIEYKEGDNPNE